jgi:MFS family permease
VLANSEFRSVYTASVLSCVGDYLARAAVTAFVFRSTDSAVLAALAALAFALSYLPWVVGGPMLAALSARYPYKRVLIACDLARLVLIGLIALPSVPPAAVLLLLFAAAMFTPPFEASRSALLPEIVDGDRYVVGLSLQVTTAQAAQVAGYGIGGAVAAYHAQAVIAADAATFALSALLLWSGVRNRPAAQPTTRTHLWAETVTGFRLVLGHPVLRSIAVLVFVSAGISVIPEGLAAVWAGHIRAGTHAQSLIMAAGPFGVALGSLLLVRLLKPTTRRALIRPLAVVPALALASAFTDPPLAAVIVISLSCGFAMAGVMIPSNGLFVQVVPAPSRAKSFGVMQGGLQAVTGGTIFGVGAAVQWLGLPLAIGASGTIGAAVLVVIATTWPTRTVIVQAMVANAATGVE